MYHSPVDVEWPQRGGGKTIYRLVQAKQDQLIHSGNRIRHSDHCWIAHFHYLLRMKTIFENS